MSTSSEDEYSNGEEAPAEQGKFDLAASDTESDDDDDEDEGEDISNDNDAGDNAEADSDDSEDDAEEDQNEDDSDSDSDDSATDKKVPSKEDNITKNLIEKYEQRNGKQLYIRFPHKLPEEESEFQAKVHELSPLIVKGHKPRQKYARFCLVDFKSLEDRNAALKSIRAAIKKDPDNKLIVSLPRTENAGFVQELVQRKLKSLENKKAKARLKRASKQAMRAKNFTSSIVVINLPKSATVTELRKLYPNAVDVQIKPGKGSMNGRSVAAITMPSTTEARGAVKQKHSLDGTLLQVRFDIHKPKPHKKKTNSKDKQIKENDTQESGKKQTSREVGATQAKKPKKGKAEELPTKKGKRNHAPEVAPKKLKKNVDAPSTAKKLKMSGAGEPPAKKSKTQAANTSGKKQKQQENRKLKQKNKSK